MNFHFTEDSRSFLAAHAGARVLLSTLIGASPEDLTFEASPTGKPRLSGISTDIDFSLSHARGAVAVAAAHTPIGIDIEPLREIGDLDEMAEIILADEEREALYRTPVELRSRRFLRYWTIKEAVLKAAGIGFSVPPKSVIANTGKHAALCSLPDELGCIDEWQLSTGTKQFTQMPRLRAGTL